MVWYSVVVTIFDDSIQMSPASVFCLVLLGVSIGINIGLEVADWRTRRRLGKGLLSAQEMNYKRGE